MKVGIVTVFKTENPGSYFQAWALQRKLKELGSETMFVDYKILPSTRFHYLRELVKCFIKLKFCRAFNFIKRTKNYRVYRKKQGMIGKRNVGADVYVYGSDTIWNFADKFFSKRADFFTGKNVSVPRYAYAASAASTSKDVFYSHSEACQAIKNFNGIAVRDVCTETLIEGLNYDKEILRVIDPTLLYPASEYEKNFYDVNKRKNKIFLIYYFGTIHKDMWKQIQLFAQNNGLKIIRLCVPDVKGNDKVLVDPQSFIQYYSDAEYVFTNTFHGCAFSIIFQKNFVTDIIDKKKVIDLLEHFCLQERVITNAEQLEDAYNRPVDFGQVNDILKKDIVLSEQFLHTVVQ